MRVRLPKELRGVAFPRITTLELNDIDLDLLLPSFFFRVLAEGRGRGRRPNAKATVASYIEKLARHPDLEGFRGIDGERLLNRVVRTSLVTIGGRGRKREGEQILAVAPFSVLSHKTGLPSEGSRQRNVDTFLYDVLRERSGSEEQLKLFISRVFGTGIVLNRMPHLGGHYDGHTKLDTLTRLSLAFLDGFEATPSGQNLGRIHDEACPAAAREVGRDLQTFLYSFHDVMPPQALTYALQGLIGLELFVYTAKLVHALNALVRDPSELPTAMRDPFEPSGPELYLDFTGQPGGLSQQMATACVRRDVDAYGQFLTSALTVRQLDRYAKALGRNPRSRTALEPVVAAQREPSPIYLRAILQLASDPAIDGPALADEDAIRQENRQVAEDEGENDDLAWIDALLPDHLFPLQRVVTLLVESQRKTTERYGRWFWGIGGINKPYGILAGTVRGKRAWRYEPSNDLLTILVQLASVQPAPDGVAAGPRPIRLRDLLDFLERRFGVLIDRPPAEFRGAEAVAAARENLRALQGRLRQMGMFRDLSDDFTVQELRPPYVAEEVRA
ncbi:MAG: hypothetical protein IT305_12520 [Chloroflexi bacterium]|nr:hypothetical protein [Chloroflexota bacterium]